MRRAYGPPPGGERGGEPTPHTIVTQALAENQAHWEDSQGTRKTKHEIAPVARWGLPGHSKPAYSRRSDSKSRAALGSLAVLIESSIGPAGVASTEPGPS